MLTSSLSKSALALALFAPVLALANSSTASGGGALNATANLDFQIKIPRVLHLAVGTGATLATDPIPTAANSVVDLVSFDYTTGVNPALVGSGLANQGSNSLSTSGTNNVNVRVVGNGGNIGVTATTLGALTNATTGGDTISWSKISSTSSVAGFPSPVLVDGATGAASAITPTSGKVTNVNAVWTFKYANDVVVAAGTYGATTAGTALNNSRVTYTASMP